MMATSLAPNQLRRLSPFFPAPASVTSAALVLALVDLVHQLLAHRRLWGIDLSAARPWEPRFRHCPVNSCGLLRAYPLPNGPA